MTRREIDPGDFSPADVYHLLTDVVVPRPIAWVSTTSDEGVDNLAPHSFFTVACSTPPIVQFTSVGVKDTLRNVRATGEFVVHLAGEPFLDAVNGSGADQPATVSEFDDTGLTREPSTLVTPPRVAQSPVALECRLHSTVDLGDSTIVLGTVVHAAVDEDALAPGAGPDRMPRVRIDALRPLSRLGGDEWSRLGEVFSVERPRYPGGRDGQRRPARGRTPGSVPPGHVAWADMSDPQTELAGEPEGGRRPDVHVGDATPDPQDLAAHARRDAAQDEAVAGQPTGEQAGQGRERETWDGPQTPGRQG